MPALLDFAHLFSKSSCTDLHSCQQYIRISFFPHPFQHLEYQHLESQDSGLHFYQFDECEMVTNFGLI